MTTTGAGSRPTTCCRWDTSTSHSSASRSGTRSASCRAATGRPAMRTPSPTSWVQPRYVKHGPHVRTARASSLPSCSPCPSRRRPSSLRQTFRRSASSRRRGPLAQPRDVSVVGYDDIDIAAHSLLTTVRQPLEASGGGRRSSPVPRHWDQTHPIRRGAGAVAQRQELPGTPKNGRRRREDIRS